MERPSLFVEPFAGAAAVSLRLIGGRRLNPPISWQGGKRRHAAHILGAMGLRSGLGCHSLLLGDASTWGWVWPVLLSPTTRNQVVTTIRSWSDEDPVALWDRLKAEGPYPDMAARVAQWLWLQARASGAVPVWWCDGTVGTKGLRQSSERGRPDQPAGQRGERSGVGRVDLAAFADDTAYLTEAVATWCALQCGGVLGKEVSLDTEGRWKTHGYAHLSDAARAKGFKSRLNVVELAGRIERLSVPLPPLAVWHGRAEDLQPVGDHSDTCVYLDPPYQGATPYEVDCARPDVLEVARRWSDAGAVVALSEAVALDGELGDGWETQEITSLGRRGAKPEWLTLNRPARARVAVQMPLLETQG